MKKQVLYLFIASIIAYTPWSSAYEPFSDAVKINASVASPAHLVAQISTINAQMKIILSFIQQAQDTALPLVQKIAESQKQLLNDIKTISLNENEKKVLTEQFNQIHTTITGLLERVTTVPAQVQKILTEFSQHAQDALTFLEAASDKN